MKRSNSGFTLVELVVVIVILGILAATALPRFINVTSDARAAAVQGIAGGLRSAVAVTQARYFASGNSSGVATVSMADGTSVTTTVIGAPNNTAAGIIAAMRCENSTACQGVTVAGIGGATSTWTPSGGSATCQVTYDPSTGTVTAVPPSGTVGC